MKGDVTLMQLKSNLQTIMMNPYKTSGGSHYTIAQGYFDVEHKYVTYLTKDNTYFIRLTKGSEVRDIGYLYAATATAQYLR
jgi:ABC-type sulfate transport system substrate-binding protein